ncbi:MAG: ornithine racemase Orr [Bacillota bacterium]|nr:ornithine racemase Orr [Bacillota bacterium]
MYPRLIIDTDKIKHNTRTIVQMSKENSIDVYAVTKVYCGYPKVAMASLEGGAKGLADSRIENLVKLKDLNSEKILLRLPMISEAEKVVEYADISLNSELGTIKALGLAAANQKKVHKIILMIDLGDLREGILPEDVDETVEQILKVEGILLHGIGVNLTCYGGVIPDEDNLGQLNEIAMHIEEKFSIKLDIVSGGNSSSIYMLEKGLPNRINNLRIGEAIVLGRETKDGDRIKNTYDDAFVLEAEIIELKEKDSLPKGTIGMDAFGNKPTFTDKGRMLRAIVAIGRQDVNPSNLIPYDENIEIIGASSDHMIIDVTRSSEEYHVSGIIRFKMEYGALLPLCTSEYVDKEIR